MTDALSLLPRIALNCAAYVSLETCAMQVSDSSRRVPKWDQRDSSSAPVIVVFGPKTFSGHGVLPQYRSPHLQQIRFADYRAICLAVIAGV
jgi:hypothetical protein